MSMRILILILAFASVALFVSAGDSKPAANATRTPVVVELFTSEGCSSCPPADRLLLDLDRDQPVPGAEVIALGEHVDYWNQQGWFDRFSSAQYTQRQQEYAVRFHLDSPYTPQMVVDGRVEVVGNNLRKAQQAIADAAAQPQSAPVTLALSGDALQINVDGQGPSSGDVLLAITENGLSTSVKAGENGGRELRHPAVVRQLRVIGKLKDGHFSGKQSIKLQKDWKPENLKAVVFVQEKGSRAVLGAASIPLR